MFRSHVALLLAVAAAASPAAAAPEGGTGVIAVEIRGDAPPELRTQLERSLVAGLSAGGAEVIGLEDVRARFEQAPELDGCVSTACLERLAEMVGVKSFVRARLEAAGADYQIALELLSPEAEGALVGRIERRCTVCTITELLDMVTEAGSALLVSDRRVHVLIETDPAGAAIAIDGRDLGRAPRPEVLAPGEHQVVATLDGRLTARESIQVEGHGTEEQPERFRLSLPEKSAVTSAAPRARGHRGFGYWKWAAAGGAAVGVIAGALLIGDGPRCDRDRPLSHCSALIETMTGGVVSMIAGVGLGGLSGWMFWRDAHGDRELRARVAPSGAGAVGSVELRF